MAVHPSSLVDICEATEGPEMVVLFYSLLFLMNELY